MSGSAETYRSQVLHESAHHLQETGDAYKPLLDMIADASVVLLGEASHGTHEFYRERAQITKLLIREKGFGAVAIEGDWPDAYRVHQFVAGRSSDGEASDALRGFARFPTWMWVNADVLDFIGWLRAYNDNQELESKPVGFYGLDLYSLYRSVQEVVNFLESKDPAAAERARVRYGCFDHFGHDTQAYAYATHLGLAQSCEAEVVAQLVDLLQTRIQPRGEKMDALQEESLFNAEQNGILVQAAERYYRTMLVGEVSSWNLRDEHMAKTLERIRGHLARHGRSTKVVIWAHNSHAGDARATSMGRHRSEWSIGQLVRQAYGRDAVSVGFTTYAGTVTAASRWDGPTERKYVRPALPGSYERLFHEAGMPRFFLNLRGTEAGRVLTPPMLERAIGVLYLPETERLSHYFDASLGAQFDGVIHIDRTRAVEPVEHAKRWVSGEEVPETFPTGI